VRIRAGIGKSLILTRIDIFTLPHFLSKTAGLYRYILLQKSFKIPLYPMTIVLIILRIFILLLILCSMAFMGHLSARMDRRRKGEKYGGFWADAVGGILQNSGERFLPIPYLNPEEDATLERWRKKRNLTVGLFWAAWVLIIGFYMLK
jgi:hypothetical protein